MKSLQYVFIFSLILSNSLLSTCSEWHVLFQPNETILEIDGMQEVHLILSVMSDETDVNNNYILKTSRENVAIVDNSDKIQFSEIVGESNVWEAFFNVRGVFLGSANIFVEKNITGAEVEASTEVVKVIVVRPDRLVDTLFSVIIVVLLAILFINFGAAINMETMKQIYKRPIGPAIGTVCQLVVVPLVAYGLGRALFSQNHELALGLFLTGISPAGGSSNIWTLLCGGNIDLSISMTTISTIACFGTIPLWLLLLGRTIFERANLGVPYLQVSLVAASLLIPLAIGLLIQIFFPRVAKFLVKIMKTLSLIFIIIIVIFGLFTNLYMMQLFAWQIVVAGLGVPILGNIVGFVTAKLFKQPKEDCIAIAIEVGVQNTALTMFLLTFSLEQPAADLSMVIPISVSILTPIPMVIYIIIRKCREYLAGKKTPIDKNPSYDDLTKVVN